MKTPGMFLAPILALIFAACPYPPDDSSVSGVTVNPSTASVDKGVPFAFTATVAGSGLPARTVIWTVEGGVGETAIDRAGVLTAAPEETAGILTVRATSTYDTSKSGTALVTVKGNTEVSGVTVNPGAASVNKGGGVSFTATVEGTGNLSQTVDWTVNSMAGTTINAAGALTVAVSETAETLTVTATSALDNSKSGTALVTVNNVTATVGTVTIDPSAPTVGIGGILDFTATVVGTGDPAQTVEWTLGGNSSTGTAIDPASGVLTVAPDEKSPSLTVTATSVVDKSKSGTADVTVSGVPIVTSVTVSPASISVDKGGTQQFNATVNGTGGPPQGVTWTVEDGGAGTGISGDGLLTVAANEAAATLTVRAASTFNPGISGTATVTVTTPITVTVSPTTATLVKGGKQQFIAMVTGTGSPAQTVDWTVNSTAGTTISSAGVLNVASGETATTLTVTATSTVDGTKSGTAMVTLPAHTDMVQAAAASVPIEGKSEYNSDIFPVGRTVTLSPFSIAKYETTYELWYTVRQWAIGNGYTFANPGREGHNGSDGAVPTPAGTDKYEPVTYISWRDAVVWCNAYSEMSGKDPVYRNASNAVLKDSTASVESLVDLTKWEENDGYRLPTEAEWEYAARGGGTPSPTGSFAYKWAGTNTDTNLGNYAWYSSNSDSATHPVGTRAVNGLELFDMSGNVWEWCWDWYGSVNGGTPATGSTWGTYRVYRGGSWYYSASYCPIAFQANSIPDFLNNGLGFRLVLCP